METTIKKSMKNNSPPDGILGKRVSISEVKPENDGKEVVLGGYVDTIRNVSKSLRFLVIKDWTGDAQITIKAAEGDPMMETVGMLTPQSVVVVKGKVKKTPQTNRGVEVVASELYISTVSEVPLPVDVTDETESALNKKQDWRFLDLRSHRNQLIFLMSSDFEKFTRDFFAQEGLMEIHTPKLLGAASESGAELFTLEYFGGKAYLAQSPQFYKQMAIISGFEKVFEIGPVFRANPSFTYRHDTEFTSLDVELGFINSYKDVMEFEKRWLTYTFGKMAEKWGEAAKKEFGVEITAPVFAEITMKEAQDIVEKLGMPPDRTSDLSSDQEKALGKCIKEQRGADFVFVTMFPSKVRPFYHMRPADDQSMTYSFDLLYNGLEITTGAQREHRYETLKKQAEEKGLSLKSIQFYLDFFRYGAPPHGGFGFGPTRTIMSMLRLDNVRKATFLHRDPSRLFP